LYQRIFTLSNDYFKNFNPEFERAFGASRTDYALRTPLAHATWQIARGAHKSSLPTLHAFLPLDTFPAFLVDLFSYLMVA
jgi:hypothetical protein